MIDVLASHELALSPGPAEPPKAKFIASGEFLRVLKRRVGEYFERTGRRPRDCPQMYFKTAVVLAWFAAAYLLLLFFATSWGPVLCLAVLLGLAMAAIGFNIQHDGNHKAYSSRPWVNDIMALTLDMLGRSSYIWNWKHNSVHHTYTNITGHDDDIDLGAVGRLSPHQRHFWFHRLQAVYLWVLYGFIVMKWHFFDDFYVVATGRIGAHRTPRPRGKDLAIFVAGKVVFFALAFIIPALLHPLWAVAAAYAVAAFVCGVTLSVVFQLAHCVTQAEFPMPLATPGGGAQMQTEWAVHQVQTTVDFARTNPVLSWLLGGLNFQVEHHLFHKICHVHYPALSEVVEQTCRDFGLRYAANETLLGAIASHFRWLRLMGRPTVDRAT